MSATGAGRPACRSVHRQPGHRHADVLPEGARVADGVAHPCGRHRPVPGRLLLAGQTGHPTVEDRYVLLMIACLQQLGCLTFSQAHASISTRKYDA